MARVVVTGGAGFLGSHLCRSLLDRGDDVVAIDNFVTGTVANVEELFGRRGFTLVEHDVSSYLWVPGPVDVVMHLASPASPIDFERIPIQILKVGGLGTHNGARVGQGQRGDVLPRLDVARCTATRSCTRSPRRTGATSTRSARAASTTRPSVSPRR